MNPRFIYPVDTDQFEQIRMEGKVYVDKTDMIDDIINVRKLQYVFLARPRRFGKSLLCNTLHAYFEGKKELFKGLKIAKTEKQWKKYPVLHFNMGGLMFLPVNEARHKLLSYIRDYEDLYGGNVTFENPALRFSELIHNIKEKTGLPAVVIIDAYDSPILRLMYKNEMKAMQAMLQEFYDVLKYEGSYLKFVFITGITKYFTPDLFSGLNNLVQISMSDEYSGICGITQMEVDTVLRPCLEDFAEAMEVTTEEACSLLKNNYGGYHFSDNSKEVYSPFSLINALNDKDINSYWFKTGGSTSLIEHMKHFPDFNVLDCDGIEVMSDEFNIPCEEAETPIPLLYQTGYLSIKAYDKDLDTYILHFPNKEVIIGLVDNMTNYLIETDDLDKESLIVSMARALKNGDISTALTEMRAYIASIPYDIINKKEWMAKKNKEAFYKLLIYMIFSLLNSKVDTEVKSVLGRADVVIQTKKDVFVLELKVDDTVETALQQIDDKGYEIPYSADRRKITKCGVTLSSEKRNISHWKATDENGNVIDEKKFD